MGSVRCRSSPAGSPPTVDSNMLRTASASHDPGRPSRALSTLPTFAAAPATARVMNSAQSAGSVCVG